MYSCQHDFTCLYASGSIIVWDYYLQIYTKCYEINFEAIQPEFDDHNESVLHKVKYFDKFCFI